ncbi:hypothetical protein [Hansschlegelia sp.]|uniref:hypothetical protein n=1 Tax=Hansschlegelia sp. TaxID=2041892 RepID=UPI002BCC6D7B|nr:hypothetical protein [Hansschlegelia sp.]HVI28880.1 hypothetical protein [Hansschlegelia sp.]
MAELWAAAQSFLAFLFDRLGAPAALLAVATAYLAWRLYRAEKRNEALSDRLIALGDRSTDKLSSLAGERMNADLALAKALEDLSDRVAGLPRGRR